MTTTDDELLKLAEAVMDTELAAGAELESEDLGMSGPAYLAYEKADEAFIAAASPDRVRALVLRVRRAEATLAALWSASQRATGASEDEYGDGKVAAWTDVGDIVALYFDDDDTTKEGE